MTKPNTYDKAVVRAGLKLQGLSRLPIIGRGYDWANHADSPLFTPAHWQEVTRTIDINGDPDELPMAKADPEASAIGEYIQRFKTKAVIIGVGYSALKHALAESEGQVAVAVGISGINIAARLPGGLDDLEIRPIGNETFFAAALREGVGDFPAGIIALTEDNVAVTIDDQRFLAKHIPIRNLAHGDQTSKPKLF